MTTPMTAITALCPQVPMSRGSRRPVASKINSSTSAPLATRPSATYSGCSSDTPTLMNRKLEPQIAPSASMPGSHLVVARLETWRVRDAPVGAVGVAVTGDTVPWARRFQECFSWPGRDLQGAGPT